MGMFSLPDVLNPNSPKNWLPTPSHPFNTAQHLYNAVKPGAVSSAPVDAALAQSPYNPALAQQGLGLLQSAALGGQPSVAELQLQQRGATDAANAFGLASSLGGRSPGMAANLAMNSAQQTQAATNADQAALRAGEMQQARGGLVQATGMYRGQDIDLLKQKMDTDAKNTAAQNAFKGGLINAGTGLLSKLF